MGCADIAVLSNFGLKIRTGKLVPGLSTPGSVAATGPEDLRMISSVPGKLTVSAGGSPPSIMREQLGQDALCGPLSVDADRGQRHHLKLRLRNIVEPDDRYVARDLPAGLVKRPKNPHRHLVVAGEDCGDIVPGCEPATMFVARCG